MAAPYSTKANAPGTITSFIALPTIFTPPSTCSTIYRLSGFDLIALDDGLDGWCYPYWLYSRSRGVSGSIKTVIPVSRPARPSRTPRRRLRNNHAWTNGNDKVDTPRIISVVAVGASPTPPATTYQATTSGNQPPQAYTTASLGISPPTRHRNSLALTQTPAPAWGSP
ncbi:lpxtg-domain-containing protein [Colletotrichum sojae]|uniref:Lpxtg-domain-containing protein n=1 Tax=Colletotrichum sojae TaxID=2175907 RepID=A0A8H6N226_9PEZI|nr:lpxtg-domain-containing protein [Colletotrichum sojae]